MMLFIFLLSACNSVPKDVIEVLTISGNNRAELEKVIRFYREKGDKEKLKAVYFLIENMQYHFSYDGDVVRNFDTLFGFIDSLHRNKIFINNNSAILQGKWDSLVKVYGVPKLSGAKIVPDYENVKAEFLIEDIEWAFKMRDSTAWGREISFNDFCEYILPYRFGTERLESWRPFFYHKIQKQRDTTTSRDYMQYTRMLNNNIDRYVVSNKTFWSYPFDIPVSLFEKSRLGACKHQVHYTALMMRASGLPVTMDFTPRWANKSNGHEWNVVLKPDGSFYPFDAANPSFSVEHDKDRTLAKVFRRTFSPQFLELPIPVSSEIPAEFYDFFRKDVTPEYKKAFDIRVPVYKSSENKKYAVICTFDNSDWAPIYFGKISNGSALFKNMGSGVVYRVMYYNENTLKPASGPFLVDSIGKIKMLIPDKKYVQNITLTRKYPLSEFMKGLAGYIVGSCFQGDNSPDYKSPVELYKIKKIPETFVSVGINSAAKYKYVRFCSSKGYGETVSEVEFYGINENGNDTIKLTGKIKGFPEPAPGVNTPYSNVFDGDLLTYFMAPRAAFAWAGLEFEKPQQIVKIKFCPRCDVNFIEIGHTYELCYWNNGEWISLGKKVAVDQFVQYKNVPSGALFILNDLTKGKEERIFTYEKGKQIWW